jgi:hypothetical protein
LIFEQKTVTMTKFTWTEEEKELIIIAYKNQINADRHAIKSINIIMSKDKFITK